MVQYFNIWHFVLLTYPIIINIILFLILRNKNETFKENFILGISIFNIILYISYKFTLSEIKEVIILNELPLHLCNINLLISPIAYIFKNKTLRSFLYYIGVVGAFIGILFYDSSFNNNNFFCLAIQGYFIYHSLLFSTSLLPIILKLHEPNKKDIFISYIIVICLLAIVTGINYIFIATNILPQANYFYIFGVPGNPVADFLWNLIPIPSIYLLPGILIFLPINFIMYLPFKKKQNKTQKLNN